MITMEFDEMKRIWDSQNGETLYGINETALHKRILSKKNKARFINNVSELLWIIGNTIAGCVVLVVNAVGETRGIFMYLLSAWMIGSALYLLVNRIRRENGEQQFDRSMRGDLLHAIALATYQVNLSRLGRWNLVPIGLLITLGFWEGGKSIWWIVAMLAFMTVTHYAAGWEHNIYKNRKRELEILQGKLESDETARS
jgi:hypothetical protein